jgi:hypothetical protein
MKFHSIRSKALARSNLSMKVGWVQGMHKFLSYDDVVRNVPTLNESRLVRVNVISESRFE